MVLFDFFKALVNEFNESNNEYLNFPKAKKCMIKVKLPEGEMVRWALRYIDGATSYRMFFKHILNNDMTKFQKITNEIKEKGLNGCYYDEVYIRFYSGSTFYIDIPLNVFSQKKSIDREEANKKLWHKKNLERLMNYSNYFKEKIIKTYS